MDERTRVVTWEDPMVGFAASKSLSGREYLQAMIDGKLPRPPISNLMDFVLESVGEGVATFIAHPAEYHYNPIGIVHGGLAATVIDSALGCAVQSLLPPGAGYTTLEVKVNFVRPITTRTGLVRCHASAIHVGKTVATAEAKLTDEEGKLYAHGLATCMIFRP